MDRKIHNQRKLNRAISEAEQYLFPHEIQKLIKK